LRSVYAWAAAQDDAPSLGDLARNLRKNKVQQTSPQLPASTVIDNDNLLKHGGCQESKAVQSDRTVFSIDPASNASKYRRPISRAVFLQCGLALCWSGQF